MSVRRVLRRARERDWGEDFRSSFSLARNSSECIIPDALRLPCVASLRALIRFSIRLRSDDREKYGYCSRLFKPLLEQIGEGNPFQRISRSDGDVYQSSVTHDGVMLYNAKMNALSKSCLRLGRAEYRFILFI